MATTKNVGVELDALWKVQLRLDKLDAQIAKIEAQRKEVRKEYEAQEKKVFDQFSKNELEGAAGKLVEARVNRQTVYNISDPKKLYAYIQKTRSFDLLQRRVNNSTANELSQGGKKPVPGLKPFELVKLKLKARS